MTTKTAHEHRLEYLANLGDVINGSLMNEDAESPQNSITQSLHLNIAVSLERISESLRKHSDAMDVIVFELESIRACLP